VKQKTLFLAWQDKRLTHEWFPVGRLDISPDHRSYRFQYVKGAKRAQETARFTPLGDFPDLNRTYESSVLFPLFMNRIIQSTRQDCPEYMQMLDLPEDSGPADILAVGGGQRATDNFEVFPMLERKADGSFDSRFFLHGWRYLNPDAQNRILRLHAGEQLYVAIELTNPVMRLAVQIQTVDYYMIGWAPRYLVTDLVHAIAESPTEYRVKVIRLNPAPAPSKQRLLIELTGRWPDYEPMSSGDFEPVAA
jgi:hypothetical protein